MNPIGWLPLLDWLALGWFLLVWFGYVAFSRRASAQGRTLLAVTNRWRHTWMLQAAGRDPRMVDGLIIQSLSASPSFFASATIIIIGGLLALLGTTDKAVEVMREIPLAAGTSALLFEIKVILLAVIFSFAFFRFTWAMRLYTFSALILGSMPPPADLAADPDSRDAFIDRGASLVALAAETFNDGIRAYYFAFAAIAWFISPLAFALASALVVGVLYAREVRSQVLDVLRT